MYGYKSRHRLAGDHNWPECAHVEVGGISSDPSDEAFDPDAVGDASMIAVLRVPDYDDPSYPNLPVF